MEDIAASSDTPMEALYEKLFDKYTRKKKEKETLMDELNRDQENKFKDCIDAADKMIDHLKSENDKLRGEVEDLKNELDSIRSFTEEQQIQFQNLMEEEKQKRKPYSSFAASKIPDKKFWGVEVKNGEPLKVTVGNRIVLHVTRASLSKLKKKANDSVCVFLHINGKKLVLAKLSADKLPQQQLNLVFEKDFELSHNWNNGSVYMFGYKTENSYANEGKSNGGSEYFYSDEEYLVRKTAKPNASKKEFTPGKQKLKIVKPNKNVIPEEDERSIDEAVLEDEDKDYTTVKGDKDSSCVESEESDKETPRKVESTKKQAAEFATKTPVQDEKAKITHKTDGKKVAAHVATPHLVKQAGKPPKNKQSQKTPTSGGTIICKSCNRMFVNEKALESHSKAKH